MNKPIRRNIALVAFSVVLLSGCTYKAGYNPSYISTAPTKLGIPGKALVVLEVGEEQRQFSESPKSFTGGGTTLELPIGEITKQIALKVFTAAFADGADFRNEADLTGGYKLIVKPRVSRLDYYYNQLKNLGFAITPQLEMELSVMMLGPDGSVIFEKTYNSGREDGDTYMISGSPAEKVNKLIHITLFKLMSSAATDVQAELQKNTSA